MRVILDEYGETNPNIETIKQNVTKEIQNKKLCFEWIDSILVKAMENGDWVVLTDANLCNPSVLGKKHALIKYDQFSLNTSSFWGSTGSNITPVSCAISRNFVTKMNVK